MGTLVPPLSATVCARARLSRDPRFDGIFYTAVKTTGIYCRPICPARPPKESNVIYLFCPAQCEAQGFRPCLRCRPELSPAQHPSQLGVARAYRKVQAGFLQDASLEDLARSLGISTRHLTRQFVERYGTTPTQIHATQRLLFARQLLRDTGLSVTHIAFASGFSSLRRFNDAFVSAYEMPPSKFRKNRTALAPSGAVTLRLCYRPPFAFEHTLTWLKSRLIQGLEAIEGQRYLRRIEQGESSQQEAWFSLRPSPRNQSSMILELHGVKPTAIRQVVQRVRRMFDLDANPQAIEASLCEDPTVAPLVNATPGLRIPGAWDGFETAIRAIIGQQISVAAAHTITQRVVQKLGTRLEHPPHPLLTTRFPGPQTLLRANLDGLGLTTRRIASIRAVARALLDGEVTFEPQGEIDAWLAAWIALPGIGPWTASYLALRVLGDPDVFPHGDLVLRKALTAAGQNTLTPAQARTMAQAWSPWRSYAAFHLWNASTLAE